MRADDVGFPAQGNAVAPNSAAIEDDVGDTALEVAPVSKNQLKKLRRAARRDELKPIKRKAEKERKKARRLEANLASTNEPGRQKRGDRRVKPFEASVVIDCGFDELMAERVCTQMYRVSLLCLHIHEHVSHRFAA